MNHRTDLPFRPTSGRLRAAVAGALGCFLILLAARGAAGEVIDRMMAIVDGRVVTLGAVREYRALAELFGGTVTADDDTLLDRVIEDILIRDQVERLPGVRISEAEVDRYLARLGDIGSLPPDRVRQAARQRLERAQFFDLRFGQFIQASDREIDAYYRTVFVPEAVARGLDPIPPPEDVREMIRPNVVAEKTQQEIARWTETLYRRSEVEVVE